MRRPSVVGARQTLQAVVRKHRPDYQIMLFMGLLMLVGLVVMYAIGPQRANVLNHVYGTDFYSSTYFFTKQATSLLIAVGAFIAFALVPVSWLKKNAKKILYLGFGACALLFLMGNVLNIEKVAQCSLGACRWFELGPIGSIQPAEILKFGLLIFLAGFLARRIQQGLINDIEKTIIPVGVIYGLAMLFIAVLQKDLGTGITLTAIVAAMLLVGGVNRKVGAQLLAIVMALGVVMIVIAPHRVARITTFFNGGDITSQITDANYQIQNAKIAIGSGGWFGVGIGNSVQASGYLPEAINDSVFAIMGEIFGFVGLVVILGMFTALLMRLLHISNHLTDVWMRLVVAGIFGWLASHVILNVAAMIGAFPLTGITLPMLSFGGTSMIFMAAALGLAFQLSRYTAHGFVNKEVAAYESIGSRRGIGRSRNTGRRGN